MNMGLAFMVSGLLVAGTNYLTRILIDRQLGMEAVGLYTAVWTLSTLYVGVILNAMGADFYPRLTAVSSDNAAVNQLVNEQTEMGVLIAIPGILATLTLAPWVLRAFYSEAFTPAAEVIRWQILGIALRVVSWPMGFVQLGKGMSKLFMLTETVFAVLNVALLLVCMKFWGLEGIGISFMFLYVVYTITMLVVCRRISGFAWTRRLLLFIVAACCIISIIMFTSHNLPFKQGILCGLVITGLTLAACCFGLQQLLNLNIKSLILKRNQVI